jgi:hypothetical protein
MNSLRSLGITFVAAAAILLPSSLSAQTVINIDFLSVRGTGETVAPNYVGAGPAGGGTTFNGLSANDTSDGDNITVSGTSLVTSTGAATTAAFTITSVGADHPSSGSPGLLPGNNAYVFIDSANNHQTSVNFTISGLGSATVENLYFYTSNSSGLNTGTVTLTGGTKVPFVATGIYTSSNTIEFENVPVVGGSITGTFSGTGTEVLSGLTIASVPVTPAQFTVNVDFLSVRGTTETVAPNYFGEGPAGGGDTFNGLSANDTSDGDNLTVSGIQLLTSTNVPTGMGFTITDVGADHPPSGPSSPAMLPYNGGYVFIDSANNHQTSVNFSFSGVGSATAVNLYFYTSNYGPFTTETVTLSGGTKVPFVETGIFTSSNTIEFQNVPVVGGSVTGTFSGSGTEILSGVTITSIPVPLATAPTIFHCTETANAGDVIGLQGDSFGPSPQVWIQQVTATTTSLAPASQLAILGSYVNGTVSYVSAQIPAAEPAGLYAVWVYNGTSYNATPSFINKARAFGAQDLCGTQVDANRSFRLFGRNMYFSGSTPSVSFVNGSTTLPATVTTSGSDANTLYVKAPAGLVSGTVYTVNVQNGYGGTWGQGSLSYTLTARTSASDPFNLGVPWGADFASIATNVYNIKTDSRLSIHAVGDGVTNDTAAIQNAINTATSAGGGVVYFPAGTYEVYGPTGNDGDGVQMWSNVVLEGVSATQSTLQVVNETAYGFGFRGHGLSHVGFVNIGFDNSTTGCAYGFQLDVCSEVFAINTQYQAEVGKDCVFTSDSNVLVQNSTFITDDSTTGAAEQVWLTSNIDQVFKNNTVSWYFSRVRTGLDSTRSLIEANNLTRNAINNSVRVESGGFDVSESDSTVVLNNVITKGGTGPLTQNDDGETIMAQNDSSPNRATGTATGSTSTTLIDTTRDWTFNYAYSDTGGGQLYYVAIVKGPGTGQIRQVIGNTTTSLTVATPWAVLPTSASNYTLTHVHLIHSLIKGNSLTQNTQGIELYKDALDDVTITGNTLTDNGSIWVDGAGGNVFTVHMDTTVIGNNVSNTLNWYTETGSYAQIFTDGGGGGFGTSVFGTEFRKNTITAPIPNRGTGLQEEGYLATLWGASDPALVGMLGVIFDGNKAVNTTNAYQLNTWDYNTTIWDDTDTNVSTFLLDVPVVSHPSVDTFYSGE